LQIGQIYAFFDTINDIINNIPRCFFIKKTIYNRRFNTGNIFLSINDLRFVSDNGLGYVDAVRIRKYASTEPTASAGTETGAYLSSGTLVSNAIGPVTGFYDWGNLTFTKTTPGTSALTVDVLRAGDSAVLATNVRALLIAKY